MSLRARSFLSHGPSWRIPHLDRASRLTHHHRHHWRREASENCQGAFDLYFILDKSGSVKRNWIEIYKFTESIVKKLENPNVRMSFITYSDEGETVMPLTSDRTKIIQGLERLKQVRTYGATFMQEGFKKANEQMRRANSAGKKIPIMMIALTDGTLYPDQFRDTQVEANRARSMGATIYTVGVMDYKKDQIVAIADSPNHMYAVDNGFKALHGIVDSLASDTCIEVTSVESSTVCAGDPSQVVINGRGFHNAKWKSQVICRFKFSDNQFIDKKPTSKDNTSITCPGPKLEAPGMKALIEVSLDNGISFLPSNVSITSIDCDNPPEPEKPREPEIPPEASTPQSLRVPQTQNPQRLGPTTVEIPQGGDSPKGADAPGNREVPIPGNGQILPPGQAGEPRDRRLGAFSLRDIPCGVFLTCPGLTCTLC
ncbi:anthrax toxin receptor-like [Tupaia chinensis]|uniref:anthrax toxin receptor-like n=1 Tax=Tupaia chinensis TaxID=246437 RepID=UPI0003C8D685|nr:anthrax toxin receptor-like [Tupaia chinensis]